MAQNTTTAKIVDAAGVNRAKVNAGGDQVFSISNPNSVLGSIYATLSPTGNQNVSMDQLPVFGDTFDGSTYDANRWALTGSASPTVGSGSLSLAPGTTASATSVATSVPTFVSLGMLTWAFSLTIEAAVTLGNHRFWGAGTPPSVPGTAAAPLQDAVGFELDTAGVLRASVYSAGTRVFTAALTRPVDGLQHRYAIITRGDISFFYMDAFDLPVASSQIRPSTQTLPLRIANLNSASVTVGTPLITSDGAGIYDWARQTTGINDGTYQFRKAQVGTSGGLSVKGASLAGQTLNVVAATPITGTGLNVSEGGAVTFVVKNTVAATAYTGTPVVVFEQSDDNVSWGPMGVTRADTGVTASTVTLPAGTANGELMLDAALEGVNWVRARVTTAPTANGMTIVIQSGGMPFTPSVSIIGNTSSTPTQAGVTASAASVTILAANVARKGATVANDTTSATLYLRLSATAATAASGGYTVMLAAGAYYEVPFSYTGQITGIWTAATGFANVTELT